MNSHNKVCLSCSLISRIGTIIFFMFSYLLNAQCTVETINNDFELPVIGNSVDYINQSTVPGWKTTAPDGIIEFWKSGFPGNFAYSGKQYVELNAFFASGLYQDFDSSNNTVFNYSFAHRGRLGVDQMAVKAGPPGGPYTIVTTVSTGNKEWKLYSGKYTAPNNQNVTRFIFEAVSTANNNPTVGNFLDAINFGGKIGLPIVKGEQTICRGTSSTLTASGEANATFNWYNKSGGLIHTGLTFVTPPLFDDTFYNVEQVSVLGCKSDLKTVNITLSSKAKIEVEVSGRTAICSNELADISLKSISPNVNYQWTVTQTGVTGAVAGSGNHINQLLKTISNTEGSAIYNIVPIINGCMGEAIKVEIKVNPLPQASGASLITVCRGTSATLTTSGATNATFNWYNANGSLIYTGLTFVSPPLFDDTSYSVEQVSASGCKSNLQVINIKVDYKAKIEVEVLGSKSICSNELADLFLKSISPNVKYNWTVTQTGVTGAVAGSGNRINQLLKATSNAQGSAIYSIVPNISGCIGEPISVEIKVNPLPKALGPSLITICSKESPKINLSSNLNGTSFSWKVVSSTIAGASDGTGNFIDQILETSTVDQGNVVYSITPDNHGCSGEVLLIKVLVDPLPEVVLNDGIICTNQSTGEVIKTYSLDSELSSADYEFQWYYNAIKIDKALSNTFEAKKQGEYSVIAINKKTGCISYPATAKVVSLSTSPSDLQLSIKEISGFSEYNSTVIITVKGGSDSFQYQLDAGNFFNSNEFYNVKPGPHTITVIDRNGCLNVSKRFLVIWYPTFFTPNDDGYNDTWNIFGLEDQSLLKVNIFDRYGKLLKQLKSTDGGWNGLYNGASMPSTDYWFSVEYIDQGVEKNFKSHFSLKR
jgi:gliding motility-associated-like protein